jgi:hypothetical protein
VALGPKFCGRLLRRPALSPGPTLVRGHGAQGAGHKRKERGRTIGQPQSWWHTAAWTGLTEAQASDLFAVALDLIADLVPATTWTPLETTRTVAFDRNDHNLWIKSVPKFSDLQGGRLRGELTRLQSGAKATVELLRRRAGAAGWRLRFVTPARR